MVDYYEVLGINKNASLVEIRKAYKNLALKYHPDKNNSEDSTKKFQEISEAYAILSNRVTRSQTDKFQAMSNELKNTRDNNRFLVEELKKNKDYDVIKKERDNLLIKLHQDPKKREEPTPLSKEIQREITNSYKAPLYLRSYYLKLMNTFREWEVYGSEEQKQVYYQNKTDLTKVIHFLKEKEN